MSVRYYHRTSANHGYSTGAFLELLRLAWPVLVIALFISAILGTFEGQAGSLFLLLAMSAGGYWGWKTRH